MTTWVYRCFDIRGDLLYVGITQHPHQRIKSLKKVYAQHDLAKVTFCAYPDRASGLRGERDAIKAGQPRFNKQHNTAVNKYTLSDLQLERMGYTIFDPETEGDPDYN